jgi:hypothetical protein
LSVVLHFEPYLFAEQKHNRFLNRRPGAVNLKGVIMKREAAARVRGALVFGGKQGIKIKSAGSGAKAVWFPPAAFR